MLAVSGLRTPKGACQIARRCESRRRGIDAPRQPRRNLLKQPAVAVRVAERGEGSIAAMLRVRTVDPYPPKQIRLLRARGRISGAMEDLADLTSTTEQIAAGCFNVGDDQVKALNRARSYPSDVLAKDHRAPGARRRELNHAKVVAVVVVGVESPPEPRVKLLCPVHMGDGDNYVINFH